MAPSTSTKLFPHLSRREFLKISGSGLFGIFLPGFKLFNVLDPDQQGRVIEAKVIVYDTPSFNGKQVRVLWKDTVLSIAEATVGDEQPAHNRIWYHLVEGGYVHSGVIQPVKTLLNSPVSEIAKDGALAEVTVPYSDAHWGPGKNYPFAYRFFFGTTYWVDSLVQDRSGSPWYRVLDDKYEFTFFAPATHLRLVPVEELAPLSRNVHPAAKRLEVRTAEQLIIAYEWDNPVFMARASTGAEFSNGSFLTPAGRHVTFHKRPSRHMAAGNLAANGYDLPGVPWISYITESGVAFHGTYWHNDFGKPRSHGCINLTPQAAKWVYRWTLPIVLPDQQRVFEDYGTPVDVI